MIKDGRSTVLVSFERPFCSFGGDIFLILFASTVEDTVGNVDGDTQLHSGCDAFDGLMNLGDCPPVSTFTC